MSLLTIARQQKKMEVIPEKGDFKIGMDEELPTCCAGLDGQRNCKYYRKGFEPIPGYRYCGWFGKMDHSCLRPNKTIRRKQK